MLRQIVEYLQSSPIANHFIANEGSLGQEETLDVLADFTARVCQGFTEFVSGSLNHFI